MARTKRKFNPLTDRIPEMADNRRIYHTGGYVRLSVEDGGKRGADTIKNQEEMILRYIEAQPDMELEGIYSDV